MNCSEMKKTTAVSQRIRDGCWPPVSLLAWRCDFDLMHQRCLKMESTEARAILHEGICCDLCSARCKEVPHTWRMQKRILYAVEKKENYISSQALDQK